MRALPGSEVLSLWERGAGRHPLDRSALLAAAARPDWPAEEIADLPLGTVNASLLKLRMACFGARIDGHADCPRCGQRLSLLLDARELLAGVPDHDDPGQACEAEVAGLRVRAPTLRDLAAVANEVDAARAARELLARCTLASDAASLDEATLQAVEEGLDELDPQADLALALQCVGCGHSDLVQLDPGQLLWDEIEAQAQRLLHEVHQLAFAYGWSEAQILALTPARRASYLAMLGVS